jgi:hypothetical protein
MITVRLDDHGLRERLGRLSSQAVADVAQVVGREAANRLRAHFQQKDQDEPNRLGGARVHFWTAVMRSVNNPRVTPTGSGAEIVVSISDPRFAQKVFGGRITAKAARALTIPLTAEAYGRTAGTFEAEVAPLVLIKPRGRHPVLAQIVDGRPVAEYLLVSSVDQKADPTALPDMETLGAQLVAAGQATIDRIDLANQSPAAGNTEGAPV